MESDIVIRAEGLGKKYVIGHEAEKERYTALRDVIARNARGLWRKTADLAHGRAIVTGDTTEEFWALKDVSFEVKRGEVLGIIGRNGAGKSTLLKILSRITEPTEGRIEIRGRVASLLEVGTGFHPELTGRENIYLNGAILGMSRAEITRKFDEIVAFAEIEKFLDTPVKRYSSGMYVRLAFAVAAHLEPEILVVDEVLAVGDVAFQKKCLGKMSEVATGRGRTVLFVSHNMGAIESLCERCILLERGEKHADAQTAKVIAEYARNRRHELERSAASVVSIHGGLNVCSLGLAPQDVRSHEPVQISIAFQAETTGQIRECAVLLYSAKGARIAIIDARETAQLPFQHSDGAFELIVRIEALPLVEGDYSIGLYLVADKFAGNLLGLRDFTVLPPNLSGPFVPYPAEHRGVLELRSKTSIVSIQLRGATH